MSSTSFDTSLDSFLKATSWRRRRLTRVCLICIDTLHSLLTRPTGTEDTAVELSRPRQISEAQHQQITAIMTPTESFDPIQMRELRRQINERQNADSTLFRPPELRN